MKTIVEKAARAGTKITIMYVSQSGIISKRIIHIISYTDERIIGYCYMRRQIRTFTIENVLAIERSTQKMEAFV